MQFNKLEKSGLSLNLCVMERINDLKNRHYILTLERFEGLSDKYHAEVKRLRESDSQMKTLKVKFDKLFERLLIIKFSRRPEAIIVKILRNTYFHKKVIDDLFATVTKLHAHADFMCNEFLCHCFQILKHEYSPDAVTKVEGMLTDLRQNVVLVNEMVSEIHERCFQFSFILEETLKRIIIVLKKLNIVKTTNTVVL